MEKEKKIKIILSEDCDGKKAGDEIEITPAELQKYKDLKVIRSIVNQDELNQSSKSSAKENA